jgi:tetratricopeptide (TPR) repeat protein
VFSAEDSVDFLKKRIPIDDVDAAKEIAIELGHLPLALECAVSCIEENDYALTDYLNLYKKQRDIRYLSALPESTEYNKAILNVWGITFDRIKKEAASDVQTEAAVQLFRLCAYCASDDIPLQLFIDGREETPQPLRGCLSPGNNLAHDSIIRKLERYSLVSMHRAGGRPLITVHRLIQEAAIYYFEQNEEWVGRCLKISNSVFDYQYGTRAEFEEFSANMPHVIKIARYAEKYLTDRDSPASITRIYNEIGIGLYYQGKYAEALEWYLKALVIRKKVLGAEHPRTAAMYNNIAVIYQDQGDYAKALEWHHKALAIREAVLGTEHTYTAATYNNIASVYQGQDKYAEALEWHHKALAIREKVLGAGHPDTAATYNNIAGVYKDQGKYAEALECYYKALAIREKVLGAGHPDTAATYNNIAGVYQSQGDYARTLEWNHKALAIQEKVLGAGHPDTATTYNNIAGVYQGQGDYAEALEWYNKALAIREKILGAGHPYTATIYNNIAGVYKGQGKYAEALERLYKALAIREKVLGAEHPDTAATENNIADVYLAMDDKVPEA